MAYSGHLTRRRLSVFITLTVFCHRRWMQMPTWLRHVLRCLVLCTVLVAVIVVEQGFRRGWGELSEPGYWAGKAFVLVAVVVVYVVIAAIWGWGQS
jgi:hypothetical protein